VIRLVRNVSKICKNQIFLMQIILAILYRTIY